LLVSVDSLKSQASNENKMSDGGPCPQPLRGSDAGAARARVARNENIEVISKWNAQQSAVRSIAWLDAGVASM
jgi:hypothetical protein